MAVTPTTEASPGAGRALWVSTAAFTVCFAVWTIFSIIGLGMKDAVASVAAKHKDKINGLF